MPSQISDSSVSHSGTDRGRWGRRGNGVEQRKGGRTRERKRGRERDREGEIDREPREGDRKRRIAGSDSSLCFKTNHDVDTNSRGIAGGNNFLGAVTCNRRGGPARRLAALSQG